MRRKLISNYIISILLLLFAFSSVSAQQQEQEAKFVEVVNEEKVDSIHHSFFKSFAIGTNLASPVMKALGQDHGDFEILAELNLMNRFFPELSFGAGDGHVFADNGIRIDVPYAFFYRGGLHYNFLHKKDTPGWVMGGIRYGFSSYKSTFQNLVSTDDYWPSTSPTDLPEQKFNSHWLEVGGGIRVKCYKGLFLGWMVYYKWLVKQGATQNANPWYIPGYGVNGNNFNITFNVLYNIEFKKAKEENKNIQLRY